MKNLSMSFILIFALFLTRCEKSYVATNNLSVNATVPGQIKKNDILLNTFPVMQQKTSYDCAVCALYTTLHYFGSTITYDEVGLLAGTTTNGTYNVNIVSMLSDYHVAFSAHEQTTIDQLKEYADENIPSIVDLQYMKDRNTKWTNTWDNGHYVVVLAVDMNNSQVTFMDPDWGQIRHLTFDQLLERWHDDDPPKYYNYAITIKSYGDLKSNP
jgi:ABC-type bacteriocin/lantibiotic exporter with double-glycine peptidase domain